MFSQVVTFFRKYFEAIVERSGLTNLSKVPVRVKAQTPSSPPPSGKMNFPKNIRKARVPILKGRGSEPLYGPSERVVLNCNNAHLSHI